MSSSGRPTAGGRKVSGKTFVLTGQLERMEREEARDLVVKYGGRVVSAVSGKVNYLVAGSEAGESKLAKVKLNILRELISYRKVVLYARACLGVFLKTVSKLEYRLTGADGLYRIEITNFAFD